MIIINKYEYYYTLLHYIDHDDLNKVKQMTIERDVVTHHNNNPLHLACSFGHLDIIKYLVENFNLTLDDIRCNNNYILHASSCHLNVIKYLIGQGIELDDIRSDNNRMLCIASHNNHLDIVDYLINQGLNVNDIMCALRYCCKVNNINSVKYFLANYDISHDVL